MPKITRYDVATTFESGDVLLKDGMYGTKQITADNVSKYVTETYEGVTPVTQQEVDELFDS